MPLGLTLGSTIFHGTYNDVFYLNGYYPIYHLEEDSNNHPGGNNTSISIVIYNKTYYMPNGVTQYLGTYDEVMDYNGYFPLYNIEEFANQASVNGGGSEDLQLQAQIMYIVRIFS